MTDQPTRDYTPQQGAAIQSIAAGQSVLVNARAGTGKTSTAIPAAQSLKANRPKSTILMVAFNVRIAQELKKRVGSKSGIDVLTLNGLGHRTLLANRAIWNKGDLTVTPNKVKDIVIKDALGHEATLKVIALASKKRVAAALFRKGKAAAYLRGVVIPGLLIKMIELVKLKGIRAEALGPDDIPFLVDAALDHFNFNENMVPFTLAASITGKGQSRTKASQQTRSPEIIAAREAVATLLSSLLRYNNDLARINGIIDFNDQVYLAVNYCPFPGKKWDTVIIDEAQDLSLQNIMQVTRAAKSQLVAFGDRNQAIYEFRQAHSRSMDALIEEWQKKSSIVMKELPLSITFRCPAAVVARQTEFVPVHDFKAHKNNLLGDVHLPLATVALGKGKKEVCGWTASTLFSFLSRRVKREGGSQIFVLCSHNGPLYVMLAMMLREGLDPSRIGFVANSPTKAEIALASSSGELSAEGSEDGRKARCLKFLINSLDLSQEEARELFENVSVKPSDLESRQLKADEYPRVILGTVHAVKGLEAHAVVMIEPHMMIKDNPNVRYVAETRTRSLLMGLSFDDYLFKKDKAVKGFKDILLRNGDDDATEMKPFRKVQAWASEVGDSLGVIIGKGFKVRDSSSLVSALRSGRVMSTNIVLSARDGSGTAAKRKKKVKPSHAKGRKDSTHDQATA